MRPLRAMWSWKAGTYTKQVPAWAAGWFVVMVKLYGLVLPPAKD